MNEKGLTRCPLHITISALFITLIVILGGVLGWRNYRKTSDIIRASNIWIDVHGRSLNRYSDS